MDLSIPEARHRGMDENVIIELVDSYHLSMLRACLSCSALRS
jgi:hypothetical protein